MKSLVIIWTLAVASFIGLVAVIDIATMPVGAASDKYDGDCPKPYTTVGRCADKCPNQTDTLTGYDQTTGAAICQPAPKVNETPVSVDIPVSNINEYGGK